MRVPRSEPPTTRRRGRLPALLGLLLLVAVLPGLTDPPERDRAQVSRARPASATADAGTAGDGDRVVVEDTSAPVAPGVEHSSFQWLDGRGWVRGHALSVDLGSEGLGVDLLTPGAVSALAPISEMAARQGAVAGISGDFYDIVATGAPYGPDIRDGRLRKGPNPGTGRVAGVGTDGLGRLATLALDGTVRMPGGERRLDGLNQSRLPTDAVAAFTPVWGEGPRARAVEEAGRVHEVVVRDGVVTASRGEVTAEPVPEDGFVLVGREAGAADLAGLRPGDEVGLSYAPTSDVATAFETAVGGRQVLVRDGRVRSFGHTPAHPRAAVGFSADGSRMFLVTVDGRQPDSRGMTLQELAELMADLGAANALNLDGGGSASLLARRPGSRPELVNTPADGRERAVPNGLGVVVPAGSGELTGLRVEPTSPDEHAERVLTGLTRTLAAAGHDETLAPVQARPAWSVEPRPAGRMDAPGVVRATRPGRLRVVARAGGVEGISDLRVVGRPAELVPRPHRVALGEAGATAALRVTARDTHGWRAPVEPRDLELSYDREVVAIRPDGTGGLEVEALRDGAGTVLGLRAGGAAAHVPVTVGLDAETVSGMESAEEWTTFAHQAASSVGATEGHSGRAVRLDYDFTAGTSTRAAYLAPASELELPGQPVRLGLRVRGDGAGARLRMGIEDAAGVRHTLDLADEVGWTGWRPVEAGLPESVRHPVTLRFVYAVETDPSRRYDGSLAFDELVAEVAPDVDVPAPSPSPDPAVVLDGGLDPDRWRFAVIAGSHIRDGASDGVDARLLREALRGAVEAGAELILHAGDLVDEGDRADRDLARRIVEEEVGDRVPVRFVAGDHDVRGPRSAHREFLDDFDAGPASFDHRGIRFVTLDTALGSLRTSDFDQIPRLRAHLEQAVDDPAVSGVVVVGHHPTADPRPGGTRRLDDPVEAGLLERWLTAFRQAAGGKPVAYVSGHADSAGPDRIDGVLHVTVPPSASEIGSGPFGGGLSGWALFGVAPEGPGPWLRTENRPLVEGIDLSIPGTVAVGDSAPVVADGRLADGRSLPLRYPVTVDWSGEGLAVGHGAAAEERARRDGAVALLDPVTGRLTGLRPGRATLAVAADGEDARASVRVVPGQSTVVGLAWRPELTKGMPWGSADGWPRCCGPSSRSCSTGPRTPARSSTTPTSVSSRCFRRCAGAWRTWRPPANGWSFRWTSSRRPPAGSRTRPGRRWAATARISPGRR